jgi:metal-sulfur cluster biosynthetic enzyme
VGTALLALGGAAPAPLTLAGVHLLALGWLAPRGMGALAQLGPVLSGARTPGEELLAIVHLLVVLGAWFMAAAFAAGRLADVAVGGTLAVGGLLLFALALARALLQAPRRSFPVATLVLALVGLVAGSLLGGVMALAFRTGLWGGALALVSAHAHLMAVGWLSVLIVGLSYTLVPMFAMVVGHPPVARRWAIGLLAAGSLLVAIAPHPGQLLMAAGALVYAFDARRMFARRMKRRLDAPLRMVAGAIACLPALVVLGAGAAYGLPGWLEAYGYLALTGWIGCSVLGYAGKIVPFMAWHHRFGKVAGGGRKPTAEQLLDPRLGLAAWWLLAIGVPATTVALAAGWPAAWPGAVTALGTALAAADLLAVPYRRRTEAMSYPLMEALKDVIDPEYGLSVVDLGLIYGVEVDDAGNHVRMTLTTPNCPMADWLVSEVKSTLTQVTHRPTHVELVWDPAWTPERISAAGKAQLQA